MIGSACRASRAGQSILLAEDNYAAVLVGHMRANTDQPAPDDGRSVNARPLPIFAILTLKSRADPSEETPGELRPQYSRWAQQSHALPVSANRLIAAVDPSSSSDLQLNAVALPCQLHEALKRILG